MTLYGKKNYWEKRFKKQIIEEDKLKHEVAEAVRKKLSENEDAESESKFSLINKSLLSDSKE